MASFISSKKEASDFNNNVQYVSGDVVQAQTVNNLVESALYSQQTAESAVYTVNEEIEKINENVDLGIKQAKQIADSAVTIANDALDKVEDVIGTTFDPNGYYPNLRAGYAISEATSAQNYSQNGAIAEKFSSIEERLSSMLKTLYPVGSIYLTLSNTATPASIIGGSWIKLPDGVALWSSSNVLQTLTSASNTASNTIQSGLPNITGSFSISRRSDNTTCVSAFSGSFSVARETGANIGSLSAGSSKASDVISIDAGLSNEIYGNSEIVQPPAYKVYAWRRYQ